MAFPFYEPIAWQVRLQDFSKVVLNFFTYFFHLGTRKESKKFASLKPTLPTLLLPHQWKNKKRILASNIFFI